MVNSYEIKFLLGYHPGQYVKVDNKWKGYVMDCVDCLTVLATSGETGIHCLDTRLHDIKILSDRSPEGVEYSRHELKQMNLKLTGYSLSLLSVYVGFVIGLPFVGVFGAGLTCVIVAFLEGD